MFDRILIAALLLTASALPVSADDCLAKFTRLLTDRPDQSPVKIHVTQAVKGGMTMKNYNYQASQDHWMTEMISPATMQWTLVYNNVMYSSSDKGKSWKKVRDVNSGKNQDASKKGLKEAAGTARNAVCSEEEINGVKHDVIEAEYDYPQLKTKHHEKFWVNQKTGWISKSVSQTTHSAFSSTTTQLLEAAPDLELPKP